MLLWRGRSDRPIKKTNHQARKPTGTNPIVCRSLDESVSLAPQRGYLADPSHGDLHRVHPQSWELAAPVPTHKGLEGLDLK
jgi:hypothetical protein